MRDQPDARRGIHLPWNEHTFRHRLKEIRDNAGLPNEAKFIGLRHGGHTAAADAELTDAQLRALSGHKTASVTQIYAKRTTKQRAVAARKMRDQRTKTGGLSE
jgi:integrase